MFTWRPRGPVAHSARRWRRWLNAGIASRGPVRWTHRRPRTWNAPAAAPAGTGLQAVGRARRCPVRTGAVAWSSAGESMFISPATIARNRRMLMSHLLAGIPEELREAARQLGLSAHVQRPGTAKETRTCPNPSSGRGSGWAQWKSRTPTGGDHPVETKPRRQPAGRASQVARGPGDHRLDEPGPVSAGRPEVPEETPEREDPPQDSQGAGTLRRAAGTPVHPSPGPAGRRGSREQRTRTPNPSSSTGAARTGATKPTR